MLDLFTMTPDRNSKPSIQENPFGRNTVQDLRSTGLLAKLPIIGLTMFLFGSLIFAVLAFHLRTNEASLQWDLTIAKAFRSAQINAPWSLMENMLFGIFVGKEVVIGI